MHIYKFRMLSKEYDNFLRDIEIKAVQTFEDFHNAISENVILKGNELASFHICDQKWNKFKEITLIDMQDEADPDELLNHIEEVFVMKNSVVRDFIHEPAQRLLYEYDFFDMKTFYIELISVFKQRDEGIYPRCTMRRGEVFEEPVAIYKEEDDEELRNQLLQDLTDLKDDRLDVDPDIDLDFDSEVEDDSDPNNDPNIDPEIT